MVSNVRPQHACNWPISATAKTDGWPGGCHECAHGRNPCIHTKAGSIKGNPPKCVIWSNYSDLTRPGPPKGSFLIPPPVSSTKWVALGSVKSSFVVEVHVPNLGAN